MGDDQELFEKRKGGVDLGTYYVKVIFDDDLGFMQVWESVDYKGKGCVLAASEARRYVERKISDERDSS